MRRNSYLSDVGDIILKNRNVDENDMFAPEYFNMFGIPFTFLPHESDERTAPKPSKPKPNGTVHSYLPDFLVRLSMILARTANGATLSRTIQRM